MWRRLFLSLVMLSGAVITVSAQKQRELPLPVVPDSLQLPADRADYILLHFWDELTSGHMDDDILMEQSFVNFVSIFPHASEVGREMSTHALLSKLEVTPKAYRMIMGLADKYLYELESPMLSEPFYLLFLNEFINSPLLDTTEKNRVQAVRETVMMNRPGTPATDFEFTDRNGETKTLHGLETEGNILLIFYNPDCDNCHQLISDLERNSEIEGQMNSGALSIVAIYSGSDRKSWENTAQELPGKWTVGYEPDTVEEKDLYDFRAIPTIYLLDKNKTILIKDLSPTFFSE